MSTANDVGPVRDPALEPAPSGRLRVLVIEEDPRLGGQLLGALHAAGLSVVLVDHVVDHAALCASMPFDTALLDVDTSASRSLELIESLRAQAPLMPIVVLAEEGHLDAVSCLEGGADDHLTKPFDLDELVARVRARLRTSRSLVPSALSAGGVELDQRTREAVVDGRVVPLTVRESALLEAFLAHPVDVLSRESLMGLVWGTDRSSASTLVDFYISALRRKLGRDVIETVRGVGYRLRADAPLRSEDRLRRLG